MVVVRNIDRGDGSDLSETQTMEVARESGRFAGVALAGSGVAEEDVPALEGAGVERYHATPAGEALERLEVAVFRLGDRIVPEEVLVEGPRDILRNLEECVAGHAPRDPDVVEDIAAVDPVHGAGHAGVLMHVLDEELEDVVGA